MPTSINWHKERERILLMLPDGKITLAEVIEVIRQEDKLIFRNYHLPFESNGLETR